MLCSRCGKEVPYVGKVCPFCHTDKSQDQAAHAAVLVFGGLAGFVAYVATSHAGWALLWGLLGMLLAGVLAAAGVFRSPSPPEDAAALPEVKVRDGGVKVRCRHCRALNDEAAKFCSQCGAPA